MTDKRRPLGKAAASKIWITTTITPELWLEFEERARAQGLTPSQLLAKLAGAFARGVINT